MLNLFENKSFINDGWIHYENFLPSVERTVLERDILGLTGTSDVATLSNFLVALDLKDRQALFQLDQNFAKHPVITSLGNHFFSKIKSPKIGLFPIHLGGTLLLGLPSDERLTYSWHQESNYMFEFDYMVNVWIPLFLPATKQNGAMSFINGSHHRGKLPYERVDKPEGYCDLVTDVTNFDLANNQHWCTTDHGNAYIFDQNLIHRSNKNNTDITRFSITVRFAYSSTSQRVAGWKELY